MIRFRGLRVDGEGWVEGFYFSSQNSHFIVLDSENFVRCNGFIKEIHPDSRAIGDTDLVDKNGKVIFASFECENGKMSRGGDVVRTEDLRASKNAAYRFGEYPCFIKNMRLNLTIKVLYQTIEIIGNQYERSENA